MIYLALAAIRFGQHDRFAARGRHAQQPGGRIGGREYDSAVGTPTCAARGSSRETAHRNRRPTIHGHLSKLRPTEETDPLSVWRKERITRIHSYTQRDSVELIDRADEELRTGRIDKMCAVGGGRDRRLPRRPAKYLTRGKDDRETY